MSSISSDPIGSTFETGQLVPQAGWWRDQHDIVTYHRLDATFPPCAGREPEHAIRRLISVAPTT